MEGYTELINEQNFAINTVWVALCAALIFFYGSRLCIARSWICSL